MILRLCILIVLFAGLDAVLQRLDKIIIILEAMR